MTLESTRSLIAFGSLYRVDALIYDTRDWGFILFQIRFKNSFEFSFDVDTYDVKVTLMF